MQTLLAKIEQIRKYIGRDKVFDSIGEVLKISPSRWLREMLSGKKSENDLKAKVESLNATQIEQRLIEYESAQGETSIVRERVADIRLREEKHVLRRMLPGYVANFIRRSASILDMEIHGDATAKFSLSANTLQAQACIEDVFSGYPRAWNSEMTVERPSVGSNTIFLHPGEPAFDRLLEQVQMLCEDDMRRGPVSSPMLSRTSHVDLSQDEVVKRSSPLLLLKGHMTRNSLQYQLIMRVIVRLKTQVYFSNLSCLRYQTWQFNDSACG